MKTIICAVILFGWIISIVNAEIDPYKVLRVDNAVPTAPALKIFETGLDGDKILRPGSARDFAANIVPFAINGGLPSNFAIEFSPRILGGFCSPSFSTYRTDWYSRILPRLRFSLATGSLAQDTNTKQSFAWGFRMTLWDSNDPLLDSIYTDNIFKALTESVVRSIPAGKKTREKLKEKYTNIKDNDLDRIMGVVEPALDNKNWVITNNDTINIAYAIYSIEIGTVDNNNFFEIAEKRKKFLETNWCKSIAEFGAAQLSFSPDGSYNSLQSNRVQVWLTLGIPICPNFQLLLGATGKLNSEPEKNEGNIALRGYWGSSTSKVFVEGNFTGVKDSPHPSQNLLVGGEVSIVENVWVDFSIGGQLKDKVWKMTRSANLRFGI